MAPPKCHLPKESPLPTAIFFICRLGFATFGYSAQTTRYYLTGCSSVAVMLSSAAPPQRSKCVCFQSSSPQVVWLDKRVEKIIQMMREDVRGELSLGEFAQSVNLSVWRLCHIFKSDVGMPPIRYLRLLRMERAKDLLEASFLSVKEIAYQVGLNDESHFVRDFKSTYGFSPALYRSNFKNKNAPEPHNGNGNGHGPTSGNSAQHNSVREHLVQIAKHSILPSVHLFVYVFSCLN